MQGNKPLYLIIVLAICRFISYPCASLQFVMIKVGVLNTPVYLKKLSNQQLITLNSIWYARLVRRVISFLVRTPLRKEILKLINFNIPTPGNQGCIIVMCHTPWKKLLSHWCIEKQFALIVGGGKWTDRRQIIQRNGTGVTELRDIIKHLQHKGRVATTADVFNNLCNYPVSFLGNSHNASLFAERLAILAKVPIIIVIPRLTKTSIEFSAGPQLPAADSNSTFSTITSRILLFFQSEIENNPAIFSGYVK